MNCEHCHIGHFQSTRVPYLQWHQGQIMVIPDAPAASCDICGRMEYDAVFLFKLDYLLDQLSTHAQNSETAPSHPILIEQARWQPTRRSR